MVIVLLNVVTPVVLEATVRVRIADVDCPAESWVPVLLQFIVR